MGDHTEVLDIARRQLTHAVAAENSVDLPVEIRLQIGLLAAQIVLIETLTQQPPQHCDRRCRTATPDANFDEEDDVPAPVRVTVGVGDNSSRATWDLDLVLYILRTAKPTSLVLVRALVAEKGRATVDRLKAITGEDALHHHVQSLNMAGRRATRLPNDRLIQSNRGPRETGKVTAYWLPHKTLPLFAAALARIDT